MRTRPKLILATKSFSFLPHQFSQDSFVSLRSHGSARRFDGDRADLVEGVHGLPAVVVAVKERAVADIAQPIFCPRVQVFYFLRSAFVERFEQRLELRLGVFVLREGGGDGFRPACGKRGVHNGVVHAAPPCMSSPRAWCSAAPTVPPPSITRRARASA